MFDLTVSDTSKMRVMIVRFRELTKKYPVVRGMASYTVIWPVASLIQQKITGKDQLDYMQALRFSIYGGAFVAPSLYCWLKVASHFWPKSDLKSAITKVCNKCNNYNLLNLNCVLNLTNNTRNFCINIKIIQFCNIMK